MTTPAPNTPLSAGDVELLREGDWLLDSAKRVCRFDHLMTPEYIWAHIGKGSSTGGPPSSFTYLGRPDQEGWIAHQGGENPAPGVRVDVHWVVEWDGMSDKPSEYINWYLKPKWRPHVPSQAPAAPSPAPSLGVDLGELRRLAEAATPGPWDHDGGTGWMAPVLRQWTESGCCGQVLETGECCGLSVSQDQEAWDVEQIGSASPQDAVYIAAANPATILSLIASARRDAEEIERLRDSNEGLRTDLFYAVQTAYRRGATEWARLNYPQWIDAIEANSARAAHTGEG